MVGPFGLVVSVVHRLARWRNFRLASRDPAARDQFRRCVAALLDGRGFCPAPLFGSTAGLLLDEYVERPCALGCSCMGPNAAEIAGRGCHRSWSYRSDKRDGSVLPRRRRARFGRRLGDNGRALDGMARAT